MDLETTDEVSTGMDSSLTLADIYYKPCIRALGILGGRGFCFMLFRLLGLLFYEK